MSERVDVLVFKAALGNEAYLTEINSTPKNQLHFIATLEEHKFTPAELIELIELVKEPKTRSLLITRLLSQKEYLVSLKGESFLDKITCGGLQVSPSRLNGWVHQLDSSILTPAIIAKLDPEAAVTILCSVPHFHRLSEEQVNALMSKHLKPALINYWVQHLASMPNAQYVLAHLMKLVHVNVLEAFKELSASQQELILTKIMEHLPLFHPFPKKLLSLLQHESYLILAMKLYLNGHFYQAYIAFIEQLMNRLLAVQYPFSLTTTELLLALRDVAELKEVLVKAKSLTNSYLKESARSGNIAYWYQDGRIDAQKITQNMNLSSAATEESTIVQKLIQHQKTIKSFDYFLIYYQGEPQALQHVLNDYLDFYLQTEKSMHRDQAVHHIAFLLMKKELNTEIRDSIFSAFLDHPDLFDEFICPRLFLYNATAAIHHFGLAGGINNYQIVMRLCSLALQKLNPEQNPELIKIAQQAKTEAELELKFSQEHGFFASLIHRIKRCYIYGWSGFFVPNTPVYVLPESAAPKKTNVAPVNVPIAPMLPPPQDLPTLLQELQTQTLSQETFKRLIEALSLYSLKNLLKDELATRLQLHNLFYQVIDHKEANEELYAWLMKNKEPLLGNQFRLLELFLKERSAHEVALLVKQIHNSSDKLKRVTDELDCVLPEPAELPSEKIEETYSETAEVISTATETLADCVKSAGEYAQSAWSWASNFGGGLFSSTSTTKPTRTEVPQGSVIGHL